MPEELIYRFSVHIATNVLREYLVIGLAQISLNHSGAPAMRKPSTSMASDRGRGKRPGACALRKMKTSLR
jgi:hypothetical protein